MVHSMAQLFLLSHYGNYSLCLVVLAMLYLTVAVAALRIAGQSHSRRQSLASFCWFIFEDFLLMMAMFTITFMSGTVYYSAVVMVLLALYLVYNFEMHQTAEYRSGSISRGTLQSLVLWPDSKWRSSREHRVSTLSPRFVRCTFCLNRFCSVSVN